MPRATDLQVLSGPDRHPVSSRAAHYDHAIKCLVTIHRGVNGFDGLQQPADEGTDEIVCALIGRVPILGLATVPKLPGISNADVLDDRNAQMLSPLLILRATCSIRSMPYC